MTRDFIGKNAALGVVEGFTETFDREKGALADKLAAGFESDALAAKMQAAVAAESARIGTAAAAGLGVAGGVTREVINTTNTIETVARVEGDGITDELVRLLGLRLKAENRRAGTAFA